MSWETAAHFQDYKDMDPALIPESQQREQEACAGKYLKEEGASTFVLIWHDWRS